MATRTVTLPPYSIPRGWDGRDVLPIRRRAWALALAQQGIEALEEGLVDKAASLFGQAATVTSTLSTRMAQR